MSLDIVGNVFARVDHAHDDDCIVSVPVDHPVHPRDDLSIVRRKAHGLASDARKFRDEIESSPDIVDVSFGLGRAIFGFGVIGDGMQVALRCVAQHDLTHVESVRP